MVGGPLFFALLMPLIIWRLGQNYTITQKYTHAKVGGFRDSMQSFRVYGIIQWMLLL